MTDALHMHFHPACMQQHGVYWRHFTASTRALHTRHRNVAQQGRLSWAKQRRQHCRGLVAHLHRVGKNK
jgi:hypothetical protein